MPATIKEGSSGQDVINWQTFLNAEGASPQLETDGAFGPLTTAATKKWQKAHGLTDDGAVGPLTWAKYTPKQSVRVAQQAAATIKNAAAPPAVAAAPKAPEVPTTPVAKVKAAVKKVVPAPVQQAAAAAHEHIVTKTKEAPLWLRIAGGAGIFIGAIAGIKTIAHKRI